MKSSVFPILFSLFFVFTLHSSTESIPFSVNVLVEEGENVTGWEKGLFGEDGVSVKKKKDEKNSNDKNIKETKKKKEPETEKKEVVAEDNPELVDSESVNEESVLDEEPDPDVEKEEKKYGKNDPKWGRYYGETPHIKEKYKPVEVEKKEEAEENITAIKTEEEEFMPIDLLLWSHGGDGYLAMINTGIRVSYLNMYSTLSVGTDYSASLERPMSLGLNFGGYYRMNDFLFTADLGYEKIWDFGDNPELNDYAFGLKAGLSYSIWSWFAISAGAGLNYNVLKDTTFGQGHFSPMFFGGFEFNLIK